MNSDDLKDATRKSLIVIFDYHDKKGRAIVFTSWQYVATGREVGRHLFKGIECNTDAIKSFYFDEMQNIMISNISYLSCSYCNGRDDIQEVKLVMNEELVATIRWCVRCRTRAGIVK